MRMVVKMCVSISERVKRKEEERKVMHVWSHYVCVRRMNGLCIH